MPSTSSNTYWQIEKVDVPISGMVKVKQSINFVNNFYSCLSAKIIIHYYFFLFIGDVISWGETCRIKHLPTRMYLSVDSELHVS